ncbi:BNR repeat-containing protein [Psychrosphaera sp. 1_MG-2023]|uniref:BNR repeat-containing protein n=1 Tax=unclassified Psychrosphaera TaxID=2641570 RepID=UPI002090D2AC|nr:MULTISPECIES: BNR repeat-containing protein [unclassified Psychrosphaera]MDO6719854.1 BNR repeat-containing protein [Psychrosphaera sp. 1_MG-2023]
MIEKQAQLPTNTETQVTSLALDNVWSGHRIKPYLLTRGKNQFVGYFDANRQMTIAQREIGKPWRYTKVDSWLGWDSHNYVTMELDADGFLHVMGNMHGDNLEYFRMTRPMNVRSIKRVNVMVDRAIENKMTYPVFMLNKQGELLVKYRSGGSGNGNEIYNIYDRKDKTWSRLHANKFLDGQGLMSGYFEGPTKGPDGNFHLIWVWRNTPNAATNHSLSYARSADLVHWTDSNGKPIALPLTLDRTEVVDPVAPFGGMINGNVKLGFDHKSRPIISYHKYDEAGNTQMFLARKSKSQWQFKKISDWQDFRWDFSGHGSLGRFPVRPQAPELIDDNQIGVIVRKNDDILRFIVDAETLKTIRIETAELYPSELEPITVKSNHKLLSYSVMDMEHRVFKGLGDKGKNGSEFYLSWHSQPGNRDRAHTNISEPSVLLLHEVKK